MPKYDPKIKMPKVVKDYLHNLMVDNKIERVEIRFEGSGDDGNIEEPQFYPEGLDVVGEDVIQVPKIVLDALSEDELDDGFAEWQGTDKTHVEFVSLHDVFSKILEHWIYYCPIDWVNGNGGEGCATLSIKNNKLNIEISAHEWVTEEGPEYSCKL